MLTNWAMMPPAIFWMEFLLKHPPTIAPLLTILLNAKHRLPTHAVLQLCWRLTQAVRVLHFQHHYSRELVQRLYESPFEFQAHIRHATGASVLTSVYGLHVQKKDDHYITLTDNALKCLDVSFIGAFMVDVFPILKHVP
ncbi:hypothetical protein BDN71DRAFT_1510108 [Pleurotus eryngii]|uniref:Uncharacterized protein n=1 Tax=Pleurotus eryngii TaxID=5323 RepID=A0A9P5ZPV0_PLEER|nr:hypothetical protein BDN71DRAFT_1510108 [Pleurotus eryngii]